MFKWLTKQYKRYKLNNKSFIIQDEYSYTDYSFIAYYPGKSIVKDAYRKLDSPLISTRHIVINSSTKKVYIEKYANSGSFKEAAEQLTKDILSTYDKYVEELQELEML